MNKKKKGKTIGWIYHPRGRKSNLSRARARTRVERKSSQTPPHSIATASNAFKSVAKISRSRFFLALRPKINATKLSGQKFALTLRAQKKKEGRTAVCNNSSSYWPARVTTLVLLATAALETTTFAPNNVDWVSADIICVCVRYKK